MTIFLTTQYLEEADRLADESPSSTRAIVAKGTPEELKREVGDEVVELSFGARGGRQALRRSPRRRPNRRAAGHDLRCTSARRRERAGLVRALDGAGIRLQGLTIEQPSLDDVFLRVTGEALDTQVPSSAAAARRSNAGLREPAQRRARAGASTVR